MLKFENLLAIAGIAAIIAGVAVFGIGPGFNTNWARWIFGPLLWFIGFGMIVAWGAQLLTRIAKQQDQEQRKRLARSASNVRR